MKIEGSVTPRVGDAREDAAGTSAPQLVEVSPRDGLQNDPGNLSSSQKVDLILRAVDAGIRRVEATSFVSPKAVPKMSDAEKVMDELRTRDLSGTSIIGLVVNERGVARAKCAGVDEVNVVIVASEAFSQRNQNMSIAESVARLPDLLQGAREAGLRTSVTIAAAYGCPFEGEVPAGRVIEVAAEVGSCGPNEVALADTIGAAVPTDVTARLGAARDVLPPGVRIRAHFHNTRNTAIANVVAAVSVGVDAVDASLGGIGGCPFAPKATGNVATEDVVYLLDRIGLATGVSLERLLRHSSWLSEAVGHPLPSLVSRAGPFPPGALPLAD